jgi:hypothetical protein
MEMSSLAPRRAQENIRPGVVITPFEPSSINRCHPGWGAPSPQAAHTIVGGLFWISSGGRWRGGTAPRAGRGETAPNSHTRPARPSRAGEGPEGKLTSRRDPHSDPSRGRVDQPANRKLPHNPGRVRAGVLFADHARTAAPQARSRVQSPHRTDHSTFEKRFTAGNPEQAVTNTGHMRQFRPGPRRVVSPPHEPRTR